MKLGERLGSGGSAEVLAFGEGRVVKLFREAYRYAAALEEPRTRAIHAAGLRCPEPFDAVEIEGRLGLVMKRVDGPSLLAELLQDADAGERVGRRLAELHVEMHTHSCSGLEDLLAIARAHAERMEEKARDRCLARIARMPQGAVVYHGDFHPGNVLLAAAGPVPIDWANAFLAHPALDVGRSLVAMRHQGVPADISDRQRATREAVCDAYLEHYLKLGTASAGEIAQGEAVAADALRRAVPDHPEAERLRALASRLS